MTSNGISADDIEPQAVPQPQDFAPAAGPGPSRYRHTVGDAHLDALLVNRESDTLVVTFHGALDRARFRLPRFERLTSTLAHPVSALFLADPALWRHPKLQLAWYTGWRGFDLPSICADWATRTAAAVGASRIIFTGSSGGGFAALQVSRRVPRSLALVFNPQTSIHGYLAGGDSYSAQRTYIEALRPDLAPQGIWAIDFSIDWTASLGDDFSALRTYSRPVSNHVLYVDNVLDFHHEQHLAPFLSAAQRGGNQSRVRVRSYSGGAGHAPPPPSEFDAAMKEGLQIVGDI